MSVITTPFSRSRLQNDPAINNPVFIYPPIHLDFPLCDRTGILRLWLVPVQTSMANTASVARCEKLTIIALGSAYRKTGAASGLLSHFYSRPPVMAGQLNLAGRTVLTDTWSSINRYVTR
ncbi:hypothetical protein F9K97_23855 [Brucella anthropi]|uniref:hypothetical protein n=1 Tax=Brucella anthropi TaxID=529 RepID=UPI00124C57E8|nr:hypothetical protein [Brucella anthropi]KAB2736255.1 hypothetical protein F9K89_17025 [Brucella anthropi]KAB2775722.1 hypothetical protein F9K97_23855 [Brucella anthropi]